MQEWNARASGYAMSDQACIHIKAGGVGRGRPLKSRGMQGARAQNTRSGYGAVLGAHIPEDTVGTRSRKHGGVLGAHVPEGTRLLQAASSTRRLLSRDVGLPRSRHRSMSPHRAKQVRLKRPNASSMPPAPTPPHQGHPL